MSAMSTAEPITDATELELPPEVAEVFEHLTEEGERQFRREILDAIQSAHADGNLRPLENVIAAWYRTLVVLRDPKFHENLKRAQTSPPGRGGHIGDLRKLLGL